MNLLSPDTSCCAMFGTLDTVSQRLKSALIHAPSGDLDPKENQDLLLGLSGTLSSLFWSAEVFRVVSTDWPSSMAWILSISLFSPGWTMVGFHET